MKNIAMALAATLGIIPALSSAAEIYNKDGNKLDFMGGLLRNTYLKTEQWRCNLCAYWFQGWNKINSQLTGFGQWEYNIAANNTESQGDKGNKTRLGFAGLKLADYGSFDYGRNYGVVYDVLSYTDMLPEFGGDSMAATDNYMTARSTGLATYRNDNFFGLVEGLKVAAQYQGRNEDGDVTRNERSIQRPMVMVSVCLLIIKTFRAAASVLQAHTHHLIVPRARKN